MPNTGHWIGSDVFPLFQSSEILIVIELIPAILHLVSTLEHSDLELISITQSKSGNGPSKISVPKPETGAVVSELEVSPVVLESPLSASPDIIC